MIIAEAHGVRNNPSPWKEVGRVWRGPAGKFRSTVPNPSGWKDVAAYGGDICLTKGAYTISGSPSSVRGVNVTHYDPRTGSVRVVASGLPSVASAKSRVKADEATPRPNPDGGGVYSISPMPVRGNPKRRHKRRK